MITAALFVAIALAGFIPSSLAKLAAVQAGARPPFPLVMHLHAVLMGTFLMLLLAQTLLVATGRCALHRTLGLSAMVVAPALVIVGFLMMTQVGRIDWRDPEIALPAFLTLALMPFAYSISVGLGAGFIAYTVMKVARGKLREVHPLMWLVTIAFVIYFAHGPLEQLLGA